MPKYTTEDIRNIALFGHGGAGKTMLAEALLHEAGAIGHIGDIDKGSTVSDFTDEEKEHKHSLYCTPLHFDFQGKHINLLDTPGYPDFIGHAMLALPAVETAVVVINAAAGIEPVTRRIMERAGERKLCRMIIINRIDAENIDLPGLVEQIREQFGTNCLPINLPADGATKVIDCFANAEGDSDFGPVADAHTNIVDQVVEVDEQLMELYLEQGEVSPDQLHEPFEIALREGHLVPICFTSARHHEDHGRQVGVKELLDVFVKLAPNPKEGNPRPFLTGEGENEHEFHAEPDPSKPVIAHVFQVTADPFVGKLSTFRVHQGTVESGEQLFLGDAKKPLKMGHIFKICGKDHPEVHSAVAGDIVAVAKIEEIDRDAVLHASHDHDDMRLRPLAFPEPMSGLAITAKRRGDESKIGEALHRIGSEDPTFKLTRDSITKETVIHGMGELHMRVILEKLKNRYNVEVETKPPKIAYRETITKSAEGHHRHKKQTGGAGQFGEVYLRVEPLERGAGFEFANDIFGGSIPSQFIPAIEKGVRSVLEDGAIAGYPLQDVKVSVYDGKHHPVDSKEVAFVAAGKRAFVDAVSKAKPVLIEPIVSIEVTVPSQHMGDITGDLSGKRGRIQGTDMLSGGLSVIKAAVPLAEVTNYQNQLKSVTGGQGSFSMEFSHYEAVPSNVQQQIVAQYKPKQEED
jgi:elongation factor G